MQIFASRKLSSRRARIIRTQKLMIDKSSGTFLVVRFLMGLPPKQSKTLFDVGYSKFFPVLKVFLI